MSRAAMDAEPALPTMRKRMLRRKELLSKLTNFKPAPVSPPASPSYSTNDSISNSIGSAQAVITATEPARRASVDTLAPSIVTSLCSAPSLMTDYGLHRALRSIVVPNEQNPIATVKDRKNANYLEHVNTTHGLLRAKLDDAITEYNRILDFRSDNRDPKIQDLLNRCFLDANNKLTKCSREYAAFCEDLHELRGMPKLSRDDMGKRFTNFKIKAKLDRADDGAATKQHMRKIENQIVDLEIERDVLIKRTGAVATLSEQVCFVEHLNDSLVAERSNLLNNHAQVRRELEQLRHDVRVMERKDGQNFDALDQLTEDCAYLSHLNNVLTRDLGDSKSKLAEAHTEVRALRNQLGQTHDLVIQLKQARADIRNLHSQLSYAKATAGTVKNENKDLHREIEDLRYALKGTKTELQELREINERLYESSAMIRNSLSYLRDEFKDVEAQAEHYRSDNRKHIANAAELRIGIASLEAEVAELRAAAAAAATGNELVESSSAKRIHPD